MSEISESSKTQLRASNVYFNTDDIPARLGLKILTSNQLYDKFEQWKTLTRRERNFVRNNLLKFIIIPIKMKLEIKAKGIEKLLKDINKSIEQNFKQSNLTFLRRERQKQVVPVDWLSENFEGFDIKKGELKILEKERSKLIHELEIETKIIKMFQEKETSHREIANKLRISVWKVAKFEKNIGVVTTSLSKKIKKFDEKLKLWRGINEKMLENGGTFETLRELREELQEDNDIEGASRKLIWQGVHALGYSLRKPVVHDHEREEIKNARINFFREYTQLLGKRKKK